MKDRAKGAIPWQVSHSVMIGRVRVSARRVNEQKQVTKHNSRGEGEALREVESI